ncbi:peptidoglycan editing factor PgeF [Dyadobacter sp. LHD-138]|uniref:peptidoglycan editing factor PgeF n=1 Tax=Dyadobacter sp. LHD-138 TaxID=3071413 RepID=UPI0027E10162|nr:peptidoglycan editing factor PgeF [Dyadobacter sp. LHD-138]MDQ6478353.1 peptidoglycan editing factor PgeF [Dyadobacter sp. LHD-138]
MKDQLNSNNKPLYRIPDLFTGLANLVSGESTRHGGVSSGPYNSLNLGGSTLDNPDNVAENNRRFFESLGIPLSQVAKSHQVHGSEILVVTQAGRFDGYDALITNVPAVQLSVTIADCTPILIFDPVKKAVAAVHAGWRGTVQQIVLKTVKLLQETYGSNPADCLAFVGTCIDACSFEVGEEVAENFQSDYKSRDEQTGKFFVDLKAANRSQLIEAGVKPENIEVSPYSTVIHNEDYFSYRKEKGLTGRLLATIGIKE